MTRFRLKRSDASVELVAGIYNSSTSSGDGGFAKDAKFIYLGGIAVDSSNNIFVVDNDGDNIRVISTYDATITTIQNYDLNGATLIQMLNEPWGIHIDANDSIYFSEEASIKK